MKGRGVLRTSMTRRTQRTKPWADALQLPPRWRSLLAIFVLIFGLMLFLGMIAEPTGRLGAPGLGTAILITLVIGEAIVLVYADWKH